MSPNERLQAILNHENTNLKAFSDRLGYARPQGLYDIFNGKVKSITEKLANSIMEVYPHYNRVWLLTGEGDMLKSDSSINKVAGQQQFHTYLIPMAAMGGSLTGFAEKGVTLQNCEIVFSPIDNADFAISVMGDSMAPEYPSGSRVFIKRINPEAFIEWGKVYVIDTCNGVTIKEVRQSDKPNCISCHALNPDPKFAPFDIPLDEVYGLYRVLVCIAAK